MTNLLRLRRCMIAPDDDANRFGLTTVDHCRISSPQERCREVASDNHCKRLQPAEEPALFNKESESVAGTLTVGHERFDLIFDCPGRSNLAFALAEPDRVKYGFLIDVDADKRLDEQLNAKNHCDVLQDRCTKRIQVVVTGLFRGHYDFPDCKDISREIYTSIVIKSLRFTEPAGDVRRQRSRFDAYLRTFSQSLYITRV